MSRSRKVPKKLELIDAKTGNVFDVETALATRILLLQIKSGLGHLTIFNTELYKFDHEKGAISFTTESEPTNISRDEAIGSEGK